jgi:hypothetical protein
MHKPLVGSPENAAPRQRPPRNCFPPFTLVPLRGGTEAAVQHLPIADCAVVELLLLGGELDGLCRELCPGEGELREDRVRVGETGPGGRGVCLPAHVHSRLFHVERDEFHGCWARHLLARLDLVLEHQEICETFSFLLGLEIALRVARDEAGALSPQAESRHVRHVRGAGGPGRRRVYYSCFRA